MTRIKVIELGQNDEGEATWRYVEKAPCLISRGEDDFVVGSSGRRGTRSYVNGRRVLSMALLRPGDFVLVRKAGTLASYRFMGRQPVWESAEDQVCAFTRKPIEGRAVRCPCGTIVGQAVADQLRVCPRCGGSLLIEPAECPVAEELL